MLNSFLKVSSLENIDPASVVAAPVAAPVVAVAVAVAPSPARQ